MRRAIPVLVLLLTLLALGFSARQAAEAGSEGRSLLVIEEPWTGWSEKQPEPIVTDFEQPEAGSVIYDETFGTITVKSVSGWRIRLSLQDSTFVKPNRDGTINLLARPIRTITIRRGQEAKLVTATLDYGVYLTIRYR